jgi:hypothetical protein
VHESGFLVWNLSGQVEAGSDEVRRRKEIVEISHFILRCNENIRIMESLCMSSDRAPVLSPKDIRVEF